MARHTPVPAPPEAGASGRALAGQRQPVAQLGAEVLDELTRRLESIGSSYRVMAQQVGALYIMADEVGLDGFTQALDRPMRNASTDQQAFDALLEALQQARQDLAG